MNWLIVKDGSLLNMSFVEHIKRNEQGALEAETNMGSYVLRDTDLELLTYRLAGRIIPPLQPPDTLRDEPEKAPKPFDYRTEGETA